MDIGLLIAILFGLLGLLAAIFPDEIRSAFLKKKPKAIKTVKISSDYGGMFDEGIILDFNPIKNHRDYKDSNQIVFSYPNIDIIVENSSTSTSLLVYPLIKINLIRRTRLPQNVNYHLPYKDGLGGGAIPKFFATIFSSNQISEFYAPFLDPDYSNYDFLNGTTDEVLLSKEYIFISPGEIEYFTLAIEMETGFLYEFTASLYCRQNQEVIELKLSEKFLCAIPNSVTAFAEKDSQSGSNYEQPFEYRTHTSSDLRAINGSRVDELRKAVVRAVTRQKYNLPLVS